MCKLKNLYLLLIFIIIENHIAIAIHKVRVRSLIYPPTSPTRIQLICGIGIPMNNLHHELLTTGYVLKAEYFLPERSQDYRQKIQPMVIHRRSNKNNNHNNLSRNTKTDRSPNLWSLNKIDNNKNLYKRNNNTNNNVIIINNNLDIKSNINKNNRSKIEMNINYRKKLKTSGKSVGYRWLIYSAIETLLKRYKLNGHICMLRSICEHAAIPLTYPGTNLIAELLYIILTPSSSLDYINDSRKYIMTSYLQAEYLGYLNINCQIVYKECSLSLLELITTVTSHNDFYDF